MCSAPDRETPKVALIGGAVDPIDSTCGLLTRIAAELPNRLAFMDVIRNMADHKAEAALTDKATPGARPKPRGRAPNLND